MKKQALSGVVLVLGGCLWSAISGYGGAGHDHSQDQAAKLPTQVEVAKPLPDIVLTDALKAKLGLEIGTAEMPDIPGSEDQWIVVPTDALTNLSADGRKATVYFSEDSGAEKKFTATEVGLGETKSGYVEVISGLFPGDTVIVKNASRIGENGISEVAASQGKTSAEKTPDVALATPSTSAAQPKTVQVDQASVSALKNESDELPVSIEPVVCDVRCPFEDRISQRPCPEDVGPACVREPAYQGSGQCDRDLDRGMHQRIQRDQTGRCGRHW